MKKKSLFAVIMLGVLLISCIALAACSQNGFKVKIDAYDKEQGSVTIVDAKSSYVDGESVTVRVEPKDGFMVDEFTVNGEEAKLSNNKYTFNIKENTTIKVTFAEAKNYKVTLKASEGGSVSLSPKAEEYLYGTAVTVEVKANVGYEVKSFKVGGKSCKLTNNKYTFEVKEDVDVEVEFGQFEIETPLKSLQNSVIVETNLMEVNTSTSMSKSTLTYDYYKKAVLMELGEGTMDAFMGAYKQDEDEKLYQYVHGSDGKIEKYEMEATLSDMYPFVSLTDSDLIYTGIGTWDIADDELRTEVATALAGYSDTEVESFVMTEKDGKITNIEIAYETLVDQEAGEEYQIVARIEVSEHGNAVINSEYFADYELTPEHEELKKALQEAAKAENYTVTYQDSEQEYVAYYTPEGIYIDSDSTDGGYFVRNDNSIWRYNYNTATGTFTVGSIQASNTSLSDIKASFELSDGEDEYYALLKYMGNGKFSLREIDALSGNMIAELAGKMATGVAQIDALSMPLSFSVTIKDGKMYCAEIDCSDYFGTVQMVTLTFGNWNETTLPITIPEDKKDGIILPKYSGDWLSTDLNVSMTVTLDGITMSGVDSTNIVCTDESCSFTNEGKNYVLKFEGDDLILTEEGKEPRTMTQCRWAMYVGKLQGTNGYGATITVVITLTSVTLQNGSAAPVVLGVNDFTFGMGSNGYQFSFVLQGNSMVLMQGLDTLGYDTLTFADVATGQGIDLVRVEE